MSCHYGQWLAAQQHIIPSFSPPQVHHLFGTNPTAVVIGTPDGNTHVYIVDARMQAVPVGVPGELLLSGPRLGLGYIGRVGG